MEWIRLYATVKSPQKGYCMRGDLCQWDHGTDPVVLEDAALTSVLTMPAVPEYNPLTPDIWCGVGYPPYPPPRPHPPLPPRELIPIPSLITLLTICGRVESKGNPQRFRRKGATS
ncbi:hypothetical protein MSG28_015452 [Choristoneura fumiferana]|uniref:Uncharacterized protein n=1 Tax=Choristoneura fumiferana TaxID=7141 RepID=A0ACC0KAY0_CHOFU|nr:hypothetical protein MSG28_015452 [Choristoneura fumiferana]